MEIDTFVLERVFNVVNTIDGPIYYARCAGDGEGWMVVWANGDHHHTYYNPADWLLDDPALT